MADVDYHQLFLNGQLIFTEPYHLEILNRMYQSYKGYPEEQIFVNKYRAYLEACHPEALAVRASASAPEPSVEVALSTPEEPVPEPVLPPATAPVEELPPAPVEPKPKRGRGRSASSQS